MTGTRKARVLMAEQIHLVSLSVQTVSVHLHGSRYPCVEIAFCSFFQLLQCLQFLNALDKMTLNRRK